MELTQEVRGGWCVVAARGRADSTTADELEDTLRKAVEQHRNVAADFAALDYISSAGLRAVLQAARAAQQHHVEFAVCRLTAGVKKVFDMSGMRQILRIEGELPC